MRSLSLTLAIVLCAFLCAGQTPIEKTVPLKAGTKLVLDFDHPDIVIKTWDKNEVMIKGTASINRGENDSAFELVVEDQGPELRISSILKDKENIPQRIVIKKGDQEFYFRAKDYNDPEVQKFLEDNGHDYAYMSNGIIRDIELEISVPKNVDTRVIAKFGLVEIKGFDGPLTVDAKFGKIDATIVPQRTGDLMARTRHGEILTNLDIKFDQRPQTGKGDHWTEITAKPGTGPSYRLEAKFGNVYLRKP